MILNTKSDLKGAQYKERSIESLFHVELYDFAEFDLLSPFDTEQSALLSTEVERHEDSSHFDILLDSWLRSPIEEGFLKSGECCTIRPELMLSPQVIRAPLRSVRPDKQALLHA